MDNYVYLYIIIKQQKNSYEQRNKETLGRSPEIG